LNEGSIGADELAASFPAASAVQLPDAPAFTNWSVPVGIIQELWSGRVRAPHLSVGRFLLVFHLLL